MNLSENFTLEEFTRSIVAEKNNIDNTPKYWHVRSLKNLCRFILQPAREQFGSIIITSGFRCYELNKLVGGAKKSCHMKGEAADIILHKQDLKDVAQWLVYNTPVDKVIYERIGKKEWIHVQGYFQQALLHTYDGRNYIEGV